MELPRLDFSHLFRAGKFSDVRICIVEEDDHRMKVLDMFSAHKVVLYHGSGFFRAKLDHWSSSDIDSSTADQLQDILLAVPPGQLSIGQLFVKCMYVAGNPHFKLETLPQADLLQLLLLADRYEANGIAAAAAAALGKIPAQHLEWLTVISLFEMQHQLHDTLQALPGYTAVLDAAASKLHATLGVLEVAWQQESTANCLRQLPSSLLLQLLADPTTKAASENTVVYTIDQWLAHNTAAADTDDSEDLLLSDKAAAAAAAAGQQLVQQVGEMVQLVRLPHCSPLFLATAIPGAPWLLHHIPAEKLPTAAAVALLPPSGPVYQALAGHSELLSMHPAWRKLPRPLSALRKLDLDLKVPLSQLKQHVEKVLKVYGPAGGVPEAARGAACAAAAAAGTGTDGGSGGSCSSAAAVNGFSTDIAVWCGYRFCLKLELKNGRNSVSDIDSSGSGADRSSSSSSTLAVSLHMLPSLTGVQHTTKGQHEQTVLPAQQLGSVHCSVCAVRFDVQDVCRKSDRPRSFVAGGPGRMWPDFFGLGPIGSCQAVVQGLNQLHLGVGDGSLHIRATISKVW